ncbi:MAG TPA: hypothetical protein VKE92_15635 [Anaerolineales bacterium]|nr:hypothetical protein [Anaerolineales bacterium]
MTITRDRGFIIVECDHCHDTLETETRNFGDALEKIKEEEWITRKFDGSQVYFHFDTPLCLSEFLAERARARQVRQTLRRV